MAHFKPGNGGSFKSANPYGIVHQRYVAYDSLPLPLGPLRSLFGFKGHLTITQNAIEKLSPPRAPRWIIDLLKERGLDRAVEMEDLTLANVAGRFEQWGQAVTLFAYLYLATELLMEIKPGSRDTEFIHFMRRKNEPEGQAWVRAYQRIIEAGAKAAVYLRWLIIKREVEKRLSSSWADAPMGADELIRLRYNMSWVRRKFLKLLAVGLHPLQDSFSPAHTDRLPDASFTITKIHVWDEENKMTHDQKDATWGDWRGQAATDASAAFLLAVIDAASSAAPGKEFSALAYHRLYDPYLRFDPSKRVIQGPVEQGARRMV